MIIDILGYAVAIIGGIGVGVMFVSIFFRRDNDKINEETKTANT